jgi:hypothetical protein
MYTEYENIDQVTREGRERSMSSKLRRIRFNSIHLLSVTYLWKRAFVCTLINKTRLYAEVYVTKIIHTARLSVVQGGVHMTHAYKLKKHLPAISSVLSVRRVGRITSCRTYIINTETDMIVE